MNSNHETTHLRTFLVILTVILAIHTAQSCAAADQYHHQGQAASIWSR